MTLAELKTGCTGTVMQVGGKGAVRLRLLDMGLIPGTQVTLERIAPLGDPIQIRLRGYVLTLRKAEADKIVLREYRL